MSWQDFMPDVGQSSGNEVAEIFVCFPPARSLERYLISSAEFALEVVVVFVPYNRTDERCRLDEYDARNQTAIFNAEDRPILRELARQHFADELIYILHLETIFLIFSCVSKH